MKKKRHNILRTILLLILILAASIASVVAYTYKTAEASLEVVFNDENLSVEVGGEYPAMDCVASSKGEVSPETEFLDAGTTGEKSIVYTVSKPLFGGLLVPTDEFTLNYSVTDTVPPMILWNGSGTVLERGTEFNIDDVLAYGDNADPAPSLETEGAPDMNSAGSYPLHVTVSDASGNETECDLTVVVSDSIPAYTDDYPRTQFGDFVAANSGEGKSFGIDVSTWQGDVDFEAVKAAGCEFVFIRIGYSSDGEVTTDSKFEQNYSRARAAGLKVGIYLYSYDNTAEKVRSSAGWIVQKLGGDKLDLPVAFDWEDFTHFQSYEMSFTDLNSLYDVFAEEMASGGYDCILYSSKFYLENVWQDTDTRPVWLAHYTDRSDYEGPYKFWQAGSNGRIDGIDGDVDLDIMYE